MDDNANANANDNDKVIKAITEYYKLKQKYDETVIKQKNKIKNKFDLLQKDKQEKIKNLVSKCVNCNQKGGTVFWTDENRGLRAECGNRETPCNLYIDINKGFYLNIRAYDHELSTELELLKEQIIRTKLDYLFNYVDNETSLNKFEELRRQLEQTALKELDVQRVYMKIFEDTAKETEIKKTSGLLSTEIEKLKRFGKSYIEEKNTEFIKNMVENYSTLIQPLAEKIRKLKFAYNNIEEIYKNDKLIETRVIAEPYTIKQLDYVYMKPKINTRAETAFTPTATTPVTTPEYMPRTPEYT
jgi:hypothetical protein